MEYEYSFCRICFTRSLRTSSLRQHDGCFGTCIGCGTNVVRHDCTQASPNVQLFWLPVLESGISAACPTCGLVIKIGRKVAASEELPEWIRGLGAVALVGALFLGTGFFIDALFEESSA
jgi:hypothetical protein